MTNDPLSGNPGRVPGGADEVRVTVSFRGTDNSIIQDGNYLGAGIAAQGATTSSRPTIDYGYALLLVIDNEHDSPFIEGLVWESYEWGLHNLWPWEHPVVNLVDGFTWEWPEAVTMDSNVTLEMKWNHDWDQLNFWAVVDHLYPKRLYSHVPSDIQHRRFMVGTCEREHAVFPLEGTVKWFQFPGVWSDSWIGQVGWHSYLSLPSFKLNGTSHHANVPFAYSVDGSASYLDHTVRWGAYGYDDVTADYSPWQLHFYQSPGDTLETDTLLWSPPACAMKACGPTDVYCGRFYVPTVAVGSEVLKIEKLFTEWHLTGDQVGTEVYGSPFQFPDGDVDMRDIGAVCRALWSHEGDPLWNYMADVVPNGKIDMNDVGRVTRNYGYTGGVYIEPMWQDMDLTVLFDPYGTPISVRADVFGFVEIPAVESRNFMVYAGPDPIGAMVIFWQG